MIGLSYKSGQQPYLLHMTLIIGVHGAEELLSAEVSFCLIKVGPNNVEMVASFCYLGDMFSIGRGCELAVSTHV